MSDVIIIDGFFQTQEEEECYVSSICHNPRKEVDISSSDLHQGERSDCSVLAWAKAFNCTYEQAHKYLKRHGRKNRRGSTLDILEDCFNGVKKRPIKKGPYTRKNRITVNQFLKRHPKGNYYVVVRKHAFAIVDGIIQDWKEGKRRQITSAWRVYEPI